jgi:putative hydrolase of the HAD superfamily
LKYKAVIFDLFGTLIDNFSNQSNQQILTEMALVLSLPVDDFIKLWKDSFDLRATGILSTCQANIEYVSKKIGKPIRSRAVNEATRMRFKFTERSIMPRPYCVEVLSNLKEAGYKTGLISDCSLEIPALWQYTPISKLIDVPIFSCMAGVKKPDPRIYGMVLDKLGLEARDCLYIGDGSSNELSGAKEVGMYPVLIHVPYETDAVTYRIDAEKWEGPVISSLSEVMGLL